MPLVQTFGGRDTLRQRTGSAETFSRGRLGRHPRCGAHSALGNTVPSRHTYGMGADVHGPDQEFLALERELAVFLRRARASSGEMAREVHPDLEPAAYGLLVRLDEAGRSAPRNWPGTSGWARRR